MPGASSWENTSVDHEHVEIRAVRDVPIDAPGAVTTSKADRRVLAERLSRVLQECVHIRYGRVARVEDLAW
jgi:hypothetical protein